MDITPSSLTPARARAIAETWLAVPRTWADHEVWGIDMDPVDRSRRGRMTPMQHAELHIVRENFEANAEAFHTAYDDLRGAAALLTDVEDAPDDARPFGRGSRARIECFTSNELSLSDFETDIVALVNSCLTRIETAWAECQSTAQRARDLELMFKGLVHEIEDEDSERSISEE